jgi:TonB-linked SusC/RagA family outer membrane protein
MLWRRDASYLFAANVRSGFFPGIMAGWNISNENFFSNNVKFINFMKIRGSYGQMGNDLATYQGRLQEFAFQSLYNFGQYPINSQLATTIFEGIVPNPLFTWERANNANIGIEATALNGKLDFVFEYFNNQRNQILIQNTGNTPGSSGISPNQLPPINAGKVDNTGFEFKVGYNNQISGLKYSVGVNGGYAKNKVVFMSEIPGAPEYQHQEGKQIGATLVYNWDGAFKDSQAIADNKIDYSAVTGNLLPGDMKIQDYNGDGVIDGKDQVRLDKSGVPTFNFGATINLQYKNFDLSILLQGATGAVMLYGTESGDIGNYLKYSYDHRWSVDNPSSLYPRLASRGDTYYTGGNFGNNTFFMLNKDYVRLKNIEFGYTLPVGITKRISAGSLRIYVNAINLVTIAAQSIYDPEVSNGSGQYYPQTKVINTGLRLTF